MEKEQFDILSLQLETILAKVDSIMEFISSIKDRKDTIIKSIRLDNDSLMKLLDVSLSTLQRWRKAPYPYNLISYINPNGTVYYLFDDVYRSIKSGKLGGKGFERVEALKRLRSYRDGLLNGSDRCIE